jgi:hypothetical protein
MCDAFLFLVTRRFMGISATQAEVAPSENQGGVMKKNLRVAMMAAAIVAMAVPALAQYAGRMNVNVPFPFVVENQTMKPGDYMIEKIANGRLRIQSRDGETSASFLAMPKEGKKTADAAHFIFRRYGSEYFLATIWTPGQNVGWEVLEGSREQELAEKKTVPVETATLVGR